MKRAIAAALPFAVASLSVPSAAQDWDKVEIKATHVAGNVHVLEGAGGNIGVSVGADGILMVDDQFAPLANKVMDALDNLDSGELEFVLNTHWHGDHTNANPIFGEDASIISHQNVRKRVSTLQKLTRGDQPALAEAGWPVITFEQSISIHFNGEEIRAVHFPHAHTDGDAAVFFTQSKVVHMGDLHFEGRFPFVDLETGGTVQGAMAAIAAILEQVPADTKFISGHGGPINSADVVRRDLAMMQATAKIAEGWHARHLSLADAKAEGLPEEYARYAWNFVSAERWIETLYNSYAQ